MKLRGKKLSIQNVKEDFTKVPNQIFTSELLNPTEKLILMRLHYYPANWILAYTRIGKELGLRDDTIIKWWSSLKAKGIIVEDDNTYSIDYSKLDTTKNVVNSDTTNSTKRSNDTTKSVDIDTTKNVDSILRNSYINTTKNVVIEEDTKEKDLKNNTNSNTPNFSGTSFSISSNSIINSSFLNNSILNNSSKDNSLVKNSGLMLTSSQDEKSILSNQQRNIKALDSAPPTSVPPTPFPSASPLAAEIDSMLEDDNSSYKNESITDMNEVAKNKKNTVIRLIEERNYDDLLQLASDNVTKNALQTTFGNTTSSIGAKNKVVYSLTMYGYEYVKMSHQLILNREVNYDLIDSDYEYMCTKHPKLVA